MPDHELQLTILSTDSCGLLSMLPQLCDHPQHMAELCFRLSMSQTLQYDYVELSSDAICTHSQTLRPENN